MFVRFTTAPGTGPVAGDLAQYIDHTLLKADATADDIKALKKEIRQLKKVASRPPTKKSSRTAAAKKTAGSTIAKKRTTTEKNHQPCRYEKAYQ